LKILPQNLLENEEGQAQVLSLLGLPHFCRLPSSNVEPHQRLNPDQKSQPGRNQAADQSLNHSALNQQGKARYGRHYCSPPEYPKKHRA